MNGGKVLAIASIGIAAIAAVLASTSDKRSDAATDSIGTAVQTTVEAIRPAPPVPFLVASAPTITASSTTFSNPRSEPASFEDVLKSTLGSGGTDLFDIYQQARASKDAGQRYLAFRIHDICMPYVRPAAFPLENPYPDGDAMRRGVAIKAAMRDRCAGFLGMQLTDFIRDGEQLRKWYIAADNPLSPNHVSLPRNPDADAIQRVRARLSERLERHAALLVADGGGALADWLAVASQPASGIEIDPRLRSAEPLYAAGAAALCYAGFDCSPTSNLYGVTCGVHASCERSVEEGMLAGLDQAARDLVRAQAQVIGDAILSRDPAPLGLADRQGSSRP